MCGLGIYWHSEILKSAAHGWVFKTITWDWSLTPLSVVGLVYSPATCPAHLNPGIPGLFSSKVKDTGVIYTITIWKIISFKYFCYNLSLELNFSNLIDRKRLRRRWWPVICPCHHSSHSECLCENETDQELYTGVGGLSRPQHQAPGESPQSLLF